MELSAIEHRDGRGPGPSRPAPRLRDLAPCPSHPIEAVSRLLAQSTVQVTDDMYISPMATSSSGSTGQGVRGY